MKNKHFRGQLFIFKNIHGYANAALSAFIALAAIPSILRVLTSTRKTLTTITAFGRYKITAFHSEILLSKTYENGGKWVYLIKFKSRVKSIKSTVINHRAWKSFEFIRKVHNQINLIAKKQDTNLIITQADMVCTQFLYIGFQTSPYFGIMHHAKPKELESRWFRLMVRMIGYMLGIKDEFNICGETFAKTQGRVAAISMDFFRPNLMIPPDGYLDYAKVAADGMWHFFPTIQLESMIFQMNRALKVSGHCYLNRKNL